VRSFLKQIIPVGLRSNIRQSIYWRRITAKKLAKGSKRLDLCAAQMAHLLHLADKPLIKNITCLEIGCGWVLSHALVLHLLGAKKVFAADITALAQPALLSEAIHSSVPAMVRDLLSPFGEHAEIRFRLDNLLSVKQWSFNTLEEFGIEYVAPINLAQNSLKVTFDFVCSFSVLEHVPTDDITPLLNNLTKDLRAGGVMINAIHLEDHSDISRAPFGFLDADKEFLTKRHRGYFKENRIRGSQWRKIFNDIENLDSRFIYEWQRLDKGLPSKIDSSIIYEDENDLRTSHIGVLSIKKHA